MRRCAWGASTPDYVAYHDDEWGRPVVDDTRLYEKLCLEGFQAGPLVADDPPQARELPRGVQGLRRRTKVARFGERDIERLHAGRRHRPPPRQDRGDDRQRARRSRSCKPSTGRSPRCCGRSNRRGRTRRAARVRPTSRRRPRVEGRVEGAARGSGSGSSARRRSTPRCSRAASSTTTCRDVRRAPAARRSDALLRGQGRSRSPR